jgi:hypothetical protein
MIRILRRAFFVAAAGLVVSTIASPVHAVQLWGILPARNQIVRVDPTTGATFNAFTPPGGALMPTQIFGGLTIAEHGAALLYQNPVANPTNLYRINPDTGALVATSFMPAVLGNPEFRAGLSFASGAGVGGADAIFAINNGGPVQRQDDYGDLTLSDHSPSGAQFAGALGGDDNGRQFVATVQNIREFSPTTPNLTLNTIPMPSLPLFQLPVLGLAFDGERIYLSDSGQRVFTIDPDTGAVLHSVVVNDGTLIGLAARFVPEPGSAVMAVMSCAGLLISRRRGGRSGLFNAERLAN